MECKSTGTELQIAGQEKKTPVLQRLYAAEV